MMTAILNFLKFFTKLTPSKMINVVLVCVIIFFVVHSNNLEKERDNYKDRYENISNRYSSYVDKMQSIRDNQTNDCNKILREYADKKNKEIDDLSKDFRKKYLDLLTLYQRVLEKNMNKNENIK